MQAKLYRINNLPKTEADPSDTWAYYLRFDSMTPNEQEAVRESNLRTKSSGYDLRRDAHEAAKIDAEDIRRAVKAKAVEV